MHYKKPSRKIIREHAEQQRADDFYAAKREADKSRGPVTDPGVLEHVRKQARQCNGGECSDNPLDCL